MANQLSKFLLFTLWCLYAHTALGQKIESDSKDYIANVQHFSIADGLSHRDIKCVFQDSRGLIWVGTRYGLNRFDGHNFLTYTKEKDGLSSNQILNIFEDAGGWLWLFNEENDYDKVSNVQLSFLNIYTGEISNFEKRFAGETILQESTIFSLLGSSERTIYIGTVDGRIISYHPNEGFKIISSVEEGRPKVLLEEISSEKNLIGKRFYFDQKENYFAIDTLGQEKWEIKDINHFQYFGEDKKGSTWFYRHLKHTTDSLRMYTLSQDHSLNRINQLTFPGLKNWAGIRFFIRREIDNSFWFLGGEQFWVYFSEKGHFFNFNDNFPEICTNGLDGVFFDNRNNAWVTTQNGFYKIQLNPNPFKNHLSQVKENLPINEGISCRGLLADQGNLWVTTIFTDQYKIDLATNEIEKLNLPKEKMSSEKWESKVYLNVNRLDSASLLFGGALDVNYPLSNQDATIIPRHTGHQTHTWFWHKDSRGIWRCGLKNAGLGYWNTEKDSVLFFTNFNEFGTLQQSTVYDFLDWDEQYLLIGSTTGIYVLHQETGIVQRFWTGKTGALGLPHDEIYHLHKDQKDPNTLWVATGGGGLLKLQLDISTLQIANMSQFTIADGLSSNVIYAVYEDENDNLWLPSDYGIIRYNKNTFEAKAFLEQDGISHHEFNRISHTQDENGNLYFGGLNGVTAFHPDDLTDHKTIFNAPLEVLKYKQFDGESGQLVDRTTEMMANQEIVLKPGDQFFQLDFALLDFQDATQMRYSYKIVGHEENWISTKENHLRISGLPYGKYELHIKGQGESGEFSVNELVLPIQALKPFYLQTWFTIFAILTILLSAFLFYKWRTRQFKERQKELEATIEKATETIRQQNENLHKDNQVIEEQAEELRKMDKIKSRFFANVSHDLRTPLTMMLGPLNSMITSKKLDNKNFTLSTMAKQNAEHLLKLVDEILDLTKLDSHKLELEEKNVAFYYLIQRLTSSFESHAERQEIQFELQCKLDKYLQIRLDSNKFEKIINNLLSNAFKFTNRGGKISVVVEDLAEHVQISIIDSGRGIHPDDLPHVFSRFYQSTQTDLPSEGGMGIGLSLSMELAKLMDGQLTVESTLDVGSTFSYKFPKRQILGATDIDFVEIEKVVLEYAEETVEESSLLHDTRVLVVEDNYSLRKYLQLILSNNYKVIVAENGKKALEILDNNIQLIISDIMMPEMDGYQLLEHLKSDNRFCHIPVIMLTARAEMEDKLKALRIGVDDYMLKPFEEVELLASVNNLLRNAKQRHDQMGENIERVTSNGIESDHTEIGPLDLEWLENLEKEVLERLGNYDFTVTDLAKVLTTNRWQLNSRIKQLTGLTAKQYIQETRLNYARRLLENRQVKTVKQTAYEIGMKDLKYFSSQFKARFGKNPSAYL